MNMPKTFLLVASSVAMLASCAEDFEDVNQSPIADFEVIDGIDRFYLSSLATDGDDDPLFFEWQTESNLISIINANSSLAFFTLPDIPHETEVLVKHIVTDGIESDTIGKQIQLPLITYLRRWGLGASLDDEKSNDTNYDWYIDQMNTGTFSHINCGPATVTMAIKWADESFTGTPEDARNTYRPNGGWWYTDNIINYLNDHAVSNYIIELNDINNIKSEIDKGNITILCLDMYYVKEATNEEWRVDKFYYTNAKGWGHFIVVKGYKEVDSKILFEVNDPYSYGRCYSDNTLKGKNRYYRIGDIDTATNIWWDYAIVVSKGKIDSKQGIDPRTIRHMYGI